MQFWFTPLYAMRKSYTTGREFGLPLGPTTSLSERLMSLAAATKAARSKSLSKCMS